MDKLTIQSSIEEIKAFKKSILWDDMQKELSIWKEGFQQEQDAIVDTSAETNPSTASVLMHLGDINGRKKAVDYILSLPDIFLSVLESEKEVEEDDTGRNETD